MTESVCPPAVLPEADRPLAGLLALDLSQFLAGPSAAMRLADLGARVQRLLVPAPPLPQPRRDWVTVWVLVILGIALLAGSVAGDPVVRLVLGGS